MALEAMLEKWSGEVNLVTIGATKKEGGSRKSVIKVGGQKTLPFLFPEGEIPHKPVIAFEVWDIAPTDWPQELTRAYGKALDAPVISAEKCVKEHKAD